MFSGSKVMRMERSRMVLLVAMVVFAVSFFLPAVFFSGLGPGGMIGYMCAYVTLLSPWSSDGLKDIGTQPLAYFTVLFSGLINPVFLVSVVLLRRPRAQKAARILRILFLLMLPACWFVFVSHNMYPGPGYFLWTAAMIV